METILTYLNISTNQAEKKKIKYKSTTRLFHEAFNLKKKKKKVFLVQQTQKLKVSFYVTVVWTVLFICF